MYGNEGSIQTCANSIVSRNTRVNGLSELMQRCQHDCELYIAHTLQWFEVARLYFADTPLFQVHLRKTMYLLLCMLFLQGKIIHIVTETLTYVFRCIYEHHPITWHWTRTHADKWTWRWWSRAWPFAGERVRLGFSRVPTQRFRSLRCWDTRSSLNTRCPTYVWTRKPEPRN